MTRRRAFFKQSTLLGLSFLAANLHSGLLKLYYRIPGALRHQGSAVSYRPEPAIRCYSSAAVDTTIAGLQTKYPGAWWLKRFVQGFTHSLDYNIVFQTLDRLPDTQVHSGENQMDLIDSSLQVTPYLSLLATDPKLRLLVAGLINRQSRHLCLNPYQDRFPLDHATRTYARGGHPEVSLLPEVSLKPSASATDVNRPVTSLGRAAAIWDQSVLCYPLLLVYRYWKSGSPMELLDNRWKEAVEQSLQLFYAGIAGKAGLIHPVRLMTPENRSFNSSALPFAGNNPVLNGISSGEANPYGNGDYAARESWQSTLPASISANLLIAGTLGYMAEMMQALQHEQALFTIASALERKLRKAIAIAGHYQHPLFGKVYLSETDQKGNSVFLDRKDLGSLLALPALGVKNVDPVIYNNTRGYSLSTQNPRNSSGARDRRNQPAHTGVSLLLKALTAATPAEFTSTVDQVRKQADPATDGAVSQPDLLFSELILKLYRTNQELLA